MVRVVERRADEIVHGGIDDGEGTLGAHLHVDDAGDENAGVTDNHTTGFEIELCTEIANRLFDDARIFVRMRRHVVATLVGHAEAAAEVDVIDGVAIGAQRADQFAHECEGAPEWIEIGNLAADMHVDAGGIDPRQLGGPGIEAGRISERHAELRFGLTRRDLSVGLGIDIRIDTKRDLGGSAEAMSRSRSAARAPAPIPR